MIASETFNLRKVLTDLMIEIPGMWVVRAADKITSATLSLGQH